MSSQQCRNVIQRLAVLTAFLSIATLITLKLLKLTIPCLENAFDSPVADVDDKLIRRIVRVLSEVLDSVNVSYFMVAGTLLGSYRHHGRIPWDDDVDFAVSIKDKPVAFKALTALFPDYGLYLSGTLDSPCHWKFYSRREGNGHQVPFRPFRWPFVDLVFYAENETHVWSAPPHLADERWPRHYIFPLVRRPFEGMWLPAPCNTAGVLAVNFDLSECRSRVHSHIYHVRMLRGGLSVPCRSLAERYPFVVVNEAILIDSDGTLSLKNDRLLRFATETLVIGNQTLHEVTVPVGCDVIE